VSASRISPNLPQDFMEERNRSDATFRSMFDTSAVGIIIMGLDHIIIDANPAVCQMFGLSRQELIGSTTDATTVPEDYQKAGQEFQGLLDGKREYYWDERRYIRKNGEIFWAQITMSVVRDETGEPLYMVGMIIDISVQKHAMEELSESEARFRAMFENAGIGITLVGLDRRPIAVNDAMVKISGRSRQELLSITGASISHPDDVNIDKSDLEKLVAGELDSYQVERRYIRKENIPYWVRQTISAVRSISGQLLYLVVMVEDIDQQKRDQESLVESEARFRAMFDNSSMGVFILDVTNLTLRFNDAARLLVNDPVPDRKLADVYELLDPRYRKAERENLDRLIKGDCESYEVLRRYERPSEDPRWARVTFSTIRSQDGQVRYIVALMEDITEQKDAEDSLRESEARFRAMFDNVSVGMSLMGLDRHVMAVNQASERIIGYSEEELRSVDIAELTFLEDRSIGAAEFQELVAGQRDTFKMEKRYVRKNGEVFWGRVTYSLVRGDEDIPQYLVGSIEDITEQKEAAEKLEAQEAEYTLTLEQRVEERTRELREANLRLVAEIEQRQIAEDALAARAAEEATTAERTRLARDLHDAVTQTLFSASLIAEVLPEMWNTDRVEARRSTEELRQLTRGALAEMRTLLLELRPSSLTEARFPGLIKQLTEAVIGRARLPIQLDIAGEYEMPPEVKIAFYRIAQESLNNIVKYARATRVEIKLNMECCDVHMEIRDNGIGFDPSSLKPTSLGMRIMHERAASIHAHLDITSQPGHGTTVTLDWDENALVPPGRSKKRGKL
jgi:PAS domain S-box-containing protein